MNPQRTNYYLLIAALVAAAALFGIGWQRIHVSMDIVSSLPQRDPVIRDAVQLFMNHPFQDQVTVDVAIDIDDVDQLVICGQAVEAALRSTGLFKTVGMEDISKGFALLAQSVVNRLPTLFTARELDMHVAPLLSPSAVQTRMRDLQQSLYQMTSIGQASLMAQDPLGLKDFVLAKMLYLAPSQNARIYKGYLISNDGRHLLVTAQPIASGTDSIFAKQLSDQMQRLSRQIALQFTADNLTVMLTPVGAYRAALDNEVIVRGDVQRAIIFSSVGIALLLLVAFPRPLIGLLSLLPAVVGTLVAFFVYAMLRSSISIIVLGFGGAIISITVDHGIAYLLFLDRPHQTSGTASSSEVWSIGLLAVLTTIGAFGALMLSDFPIFQQLGLFTSLGICFSFLFVHYVFPKIFPTLQAARDRRLPLPRIADGLFSFGKKGAVVALLFFGCMLFWAKPDFNVNLSAMNTVSQATQAADAKMMAVWGDIFSKVYLMTEAPSITALQAKNDRLLAMMEADPSPRLLSQAFLPSMIFPGTERSAANRSAWRFFWTPPRIAALKQNLTAAGRQVGFTANAFDPFFTQLMATDDSLQQSGIPADYYSLMGIAAGRDADPWRQFANLVLPEAYPGEQFYDRYGQTALIFVPDLFSRQLGHLLFHTFMKLMALIAPAVVLLLLVFFWDWKLTATALSPVVFAMVCTLGTLSLLGRPLDIPAMMLSVIVLGMGIDYSLFMVRAYQRYGRADHPSFNLIRSAVVMTAASTLIGFGVLATAKHALLNSTGVTAFFAIAYSAIGVFLILPPLLRRQFETPMKIPESITEKHQRVLLRYCRLEPHARMFARFKMKLDPMFGELDQRIKFAQPPQTLIDIGTGYGVPACWLAETYPGLKIFGIEPSADRVRVANHALGANGRIICGMAPELPPSAYNTDGAMMLDMIHFLSDDQFTITLQRLYQRLTPGAPLVIRAVMVPKDKKPLSWHFEALRHRFNKLTPTYRTESQLVSLLQQEGFQVDQTAVSGRNGDMLWVCGTKM